MPQADPPTAQDLADVKVALGELIGQLNILATKEDLEEAREDLGSRSRRRFTVAVVGVLLVAVLVFSFHLYDSARLSNVERVCVKETNGLNGLIDQNEATLRTALTNSTDPRAAKFLTDQLAAYEAHRVPTKDCSK